MVRSLAAAILTAAISAAGCHGAEAKRSSFGTLPDGRAVEAVTLTNAKGVSARIIGYGAALQSLSAPDRRGAIDDIVLGYASLDGYLAKPNYFGASVGRYANRIAGGKFTLDGKDYALAKNDGPNSLHGGERGFDKRLWTIAEVRSGPVAKVTLTYLSPDGEEGFPGALSVSVTYSLDEAGELGIEYRATTDRTTVVNLTGHAYFNLAGERANKSVMDHRLTIPAENFTPINATLIPTGRIEPVDGTPFDFRQPTAIGARIRGMNNRQLQFGRGYDHNWVIARDVSKAPRLNARVEDVGSGRVLEVWSNQPGVQFYSGNFLDGTIVGKSGKAYRQGDGFCLEPQLFPDTPNRPEFGTARLEPGQTYVNRISYRLSVSR